MAHPRGRLGGAYSEGECALLGIGRATSARAHKKESGAPSCQEAGFALTLRSADRGSSLLLFIRDPPFVDLVPSRYQNLHAHDPIVRS
jgi:hypothetical protein